MQQFSKGEVMAFGPPPKDECSPFTWDPDALSESKNVPGSFGRNAYQDETMFGTNCLTALDLADTSTIYTHERITWYSEQFDKNCAVDEKQCTCMRYLAKDPAVRQGLHNLLVFYTDAALALSDTLMTHSSP